MPKLRYSSSSSWPGPWLLDRSALESLDDAFRSVAEAMTARQRDDVTRWVAREFQSRVKIEQLGLREGETISAEAGGALWDELVAKRLAAEGKPAQELQVTRRDGTILSASSFSELFSAAEMASARPTSMTYSISHRRAWARVSFRRLTNELDVQCAPEGDSVAEAAADRLRHWAEVHSPPRFMVFWDKAVGFHWGVVLFALSIFASWTSSRNKAALNPTVRDLLATEWTQDSRDKALELLLRAEFSVYPEQAASASTARHLSVAFVVLLAASVLLHIRPRLELGIGIGGVRRLAAWRWWTRLYGVSIPALVATSVFWPYILSLLGLQ